MRILVVEDEDKIASLIIRGLKEQKYVADRAADGEEALYFVDINPYDLIILDIMLSKQDGFEVCRALREKKIKIPILMLTARTQVKDRVKGLNAGADDYLSKPFAFSELLARIRALLRRPTEHFDNVFRVGDLKLNSLNHEVMRGEKLINLTTKEYALLEYFMRHAGQVVTRTMISEHVWNEDFHSLSNVIDVHVRYLRRKIDEGTGNKLLHTIRGTGYILKE
ncbi:MAG: response regulator transcription factor [Candidatus Omnitrophica bacterium]|nr:response regulator transcription factor [Candidatus Omnitrophota bacterium]